MIENEIILLMMSLTLRFRVLYRTCAHDINISSTMINVHDIVYYFHVLRVICWILVIPLCELILGHLICIRLLGGIHATCCRAAFICVVIGLICLHIYLIIQFLCALLLTIRVAGDSVIPCCVSD